MYDSIKESKELKKTKAAVKVSRKRLCAELDKCRSRLLILESIINDECQSSGPSIRNLSIMDKLELQKCRLEQENLALVSSRNESLGLIYRRNEPQNIYLSWPNQFK